MEGSGLDFGGPGPRFRRVLGRIFRDFGRLGKETAGTDFELAATAAQFQLEARVARSSYSNVEPQPRFPRKGGRRWSPPGGLQSAAHRRWCTACKTPITNFNIKHQTPSSNGLSTSVSEIFVFPLPIIPPQARPVHRSPAQKYRFLCLFRLLGSIFSPPERASKTTTKKHRKKCENRGFWPPETLPKPSRNPSKIDVPKDIQIFRAF